MSGIIPLPPGPFSTISADPPWSYDAKGSRAAPDWKGNFRYSTMSLDAIKAIPVADVAAKDAHMYLWTTSSFLEDAFDIMRKWGFKYKHTMVWVKVKKGTMEPRMGMGHYYRHAHELVLFGVRGRAPARVHNLPTVFFAERSAHSKKPEILQDWAEKLSPEGKRLEMFATRARPGWEAWGMQAPKMAETESGLLAGERAIEEGIARVG